MPAPRETDGLDPGTGLPYADDAVGELGGGRLGARGAGVEVHVEVEFHHAGLVVAVFVLAALLGDALAYAGDGADGGGGDDGEGDCEAHYEVHGCGFWGVVGCGCVGGEGLIIENGLRREICDECTYM